jgi:LCP family protein required for cell wall assembly
MATPTSSSGRARVPGAGDADRVRGRASVGGSGADDPRFGGRAGGAAGGGYGGPGREPVGPVRGRAGIPGGGSGGGPGGAPPQRGRPGGPGGPDRPGGPGAPGRAYRGRRRPRWGRIALVAGLALALVLLLSGFGIFLYARSLDGKVGRFDAFGQVVGARPNVVAPGATNILMLGSDSRNPDTTQGSRTDTIMLLHVQADHKRAYVISIPRDTYVYIPKSQTRPGFGDTKDKINSAFAWGGPSLMVQTVEGFTGVRIDHVALVDFAGFKDVTDALGGVDMPIDQTITSIHPPHRTFVKSASHHFTGAEALDYVRQRYQFADGDLTRARHQQQFLRAIMDKAASSGTLSNPFKLNAFLQSVTKAIKVDKTFSLTGTAWQLHGLRSANLKFMTSPISGFGMINGESVVLSDKTKATALFDAVSKDKVADWLAGRPT